MKIDFDDLRRVVVFRSATDADLAAILQNCLPRRVEEGGYFFMQGDPADYLYVLTGGSLKLCQVNPAGQQVNLRTIYAWQMFGALGAVRAVASYPASAQALEDSSALSISSAFFHDFIAARPHISFDLMGLMTAYIQEMQERYRELATERVEQRIARALLRLASLSGERIEPDGSIELAFSRQDLAEMTGSTLYTVSRMLSEWERQGLIETGRERVTLRSPHGLVRIAEDLVR
jgi:CRP-like cAMP-binding protein